MRKEVPEGKKLLYCFGLRTDVGPDMHTKWRLNRQ